MRSACRDIAMTRSCRFVAVLVWEKTPEHYRRREVYCNEFITGVVINPLHPRFQG